ncbi:MAG TPA: hypothetical protein VI585_21845 [Candidatus Binatia bacterium]
MPSLRIGERGRIIGITIVITTLYLLLQQAWLGLTGLLSGQSILERPSAAELDREAKEVATLSEKALQTALAGSRHAIWQLGFNLGSVSQVIGSYAMSGEDVQTKARQAAEPALVEANSLAQTLGLGPVTPLATRTLDDFARLTDRIEADETGLAGRVTVAFSRHHRHLFLLGMHLGTEAARIQWSGGSLSLPPRAQIRRHATLAGIAPAIWEPLAAAPGYREQPGEVLARYRNGLTALVAALSSATATN